MIEELLILITSALCASTTTTYPALCHPAPDNLIVCTNSQLTLQLKAVDSSNSPTPAGSCSPTTSPTACYFDLLSLGTENITITTSGLLKYTPTSSGSKTFYALVWDDSSMISSGTAGTDDSSLSNALPLIFDVRDPNFPSIKLTSSSSCTSACTSSNNYCSSCITPACNVPYIGKFSITSGDTNQFEFSLGSSNIVHITVLKNGVFYYEPIVCTTDSVSWSIQVYDKATTCYETLTLGPYYPNIAPVIFPSSGLTYSFYCSPSPLDFSVTDQNHDISDVTVSINNTSSFPISTVINGSTKTITVTPISTLAYGTYYLKITAIDSGITSGGNNKMSTSITITYSYLQNPAYSAVIGTAMTKTIYRYSGEWFYDPSYSLSSYVYRLSIDSTKSINDFQVDLIDNQSGLIRIIEGAIDRYADNTQIVIYYEISFDNCACCALTSEASLTLEIQYPPIILPPSPIYYFFGYQITVPLTITYYNLDELTLSFNNFSPTVSRTSSSISLIWTTVSKGSFGEGEDAPTGTDYYVVQASTPSYFGSPIVASMQFKINLRSYSNPQIVTIPDSNLVAYASQSFTLDVKYYVTYSISSLLTFSSDHSQTSLVYSLTSGGIFTLAQSDMSSYLAGSGYKESELITVTIGDSVTATSFSQTFKLQVLADSQTFSMTNNWNYDCYVDLLCTVPITDYFSTDMASITLDSYSYTALPSGAAGSDNSLTWTPTSSFGNSGYITFTGVFKGITVSSTFILIVHRPPLIKTPPLQAYQLFIGGYWSYKLEYLSYLNGESVACTKSISSNFDSPPTWSSRTLTWDGVDNAVTQNGVKTYPSTVSITFTCYLQAMHSMSRSNTISLTFRNNCTASTFSQTWYTNYFWQYTSEAVSSNADVADLSILLENSPTTMGAVPLSKTTNATTGVSSYNLTWIPQTAGTYTFNILCQTTFKDSKILPQITTTQSTLTIQDISDPSIGDICYPPPVIGEGTVWTCNVEVGPDITSCTFKNANIGSCDVYQTVVQTGSSKYCTVTWNALNGYNDLSSSDNGYILTMEAKDALGRIIDKTFSLHPNERPTFPGISTTYDLKLGRTPWSQWFTATDSQTVSYSITTDFSGPTIDSTTGLVQWTTPDSLPDGKTYPYQLSLTVCAQDDHQYYPLMGCITATLNIVGANEIPAPRCPSVDQLSIPAEILFTWDTSVSETDATDGTIDYTLSPSYSTISYSSSGTLTWIPPNSTPTPTLTVYAQNSLTLVTGYCSFILYPYYEPIITPMTGTWSLNEHDFAYYRIAYSEKYTYIEDLFTTLTYDSSFMPAFTPGDFGLVQISVGSINTGSIEYAKFSLCVDDHKRYPKQACQDFDMVITPINDPPQILIYDSSNPFYSTNPIKQFLFTGFKQGRIDTRYFKIYDSDNPISDLSLTVVGTNPYGITVAPISTGSDTYEVSWTPMYYHTSSGIITVKVYETANPTNYDIAEIIIYNVEWTQFQTTFTTIPTQTVSEDDSLLIDLTYFNPYKSLDQLTVTLGGDTVPGLALKGKGTILKSPYIMSYSISKTVIVTVCDNDNICGETRFNINVNIVNHPPYFTYWQNTGFEIYRSTQIAGWALQGADYELDGYRFCVMPRTNEATNGVISINGNNNLVWSSISVTMFWSDIFEVRITDQDQSIACNSLASYSSAYIAFCQGFNCTSLLYGDLLNYGDWIDFNSPYISIYGYEGDITIYVGTRVCTFISQDLDITTCNIDSNYNIMNFPIFLENYMGISTIYPQNFNHNTTTVPRQWIVDPSTCTTSYWGYTTCTGYIPAGCWATSPSSNTGATGSIIVLESGCGNFLSDFTCFTSYNSGTPVEGVFYVDSNNNKKGYCAIAQPDPSWNSNSNPAACKIYVCPRDKYSDDCGYSNLTVYGEPALLSDGSGHSLGGYSFTFSVDWKYWSPCPTSYLNFGGYKIVTASSCTSNSVTVIVPPELDTANVVVYLSPISDPYQWSSKTATFTYSSDVFNSGQYLDNTGQIKDCPTGSKCAPGQSVVYQPTPCKAGTYQDQTAKSSCKTCQRGYMCPDDGMPAQEICQAGFICDRSGIQLPFAACPPGHYCNEGTNTQIISNNYDYWNLKLHSLINNTDHWWKRGSAMGDSADYYTSPHFIPDCINSARNGAEPLNGITAVAPKLCPENAYCSMAVNTSTLSTTKTDWWAPRSCMLGFVCEPGSGEMWDNDSTCEVGKYCPGKQTDDICNPGTQCMTCSCPYGYYCPVEGLSDPMECSPGYYQKECGKSSCTPCDVGYYCDSAKTENRTVFSKICQPGYYCDTASTLPVACAPSTYNPYWAKGACIQCEIGYYCPNQAMTEHWPCKSGYICNRVGLSDGDACPEGYYCESGVNSTVSDTGYCDETLYKCPILCPAGSMCPEGSSKNTICPVGFYQNEKGKGDCYTCPLGYICPKTNSTEPTLCPAGYYCDLEGLFDTTGPCPPGYFCLEGTNTKVSSFTSGRLLESSYVTSCKVNPPYDKTPVPCQPGYACPSGTGSADPNDSNGPQICAVGSYNDRCMASRCSNCPDGYYCPTAGTVKPLPCPLGKYRSGVTPNCQDCPQGRWSGGNIGLKSYLNCKLCPAKYVCGITGISYMSEMSLCPAGFICPEGTSAAYILSDAKYYCPEGISDNAQLVNYTCPAGYYCPEGTGITNDMLEICQSTPDDCVVGYKCPRNSYCPQGSGAGIPCPSGTISEEGAKSLYGCIKDPSKDAAIYGTISPFSYFNASINDDQSFLYMDSMGYATFVFNTTKFPPSSMPDQYILSIQYTDSYGTVKKIPFVQYESFSPLYRIPLAYVYSSTISEQGKVWDFAVLSHTSLKLEFKIELLYGLFVDSSLYSLFENCITLSSLTYPTRNSGTSFLAVLNRLSNDDFNQPNNLGIFSILPNSSQVDSYDTYDPEIINDISATMTSSLGDNDQSESVYNQDTLKLWDWLMLSQNLYPIDYIPYITDCDEYGANIPIYKIVTHPSCDLVDTKDTTWVDILSPFKVPHGDVCDISLTCRIAENVLASSTKDNWIAAYELSKSYIFYLTRPQLEQSYYEKNIPNSTTSGNEFSSSYYGSGNLISVQASRGNADYSTGMIPRKVRLEVGYYQKSLIDKEILQAIIYFSEFDKNTTNREYEFTFYLYPLHWKECLDLFAFQEYLYYLFVMLLCLFIFTCVIVFWALNYTFSSILPRPKLKITLYLKYSFSSLKGISMGALPCFGLCLGLMEIYSNIEYLQTIPGDWDDTEPITPGLATDSQRIQTYQNGRLGASMCILGWYMIYRASTLLFPKVEKCENPDELRDLDEENKRLKGLFFWQSIPVLILCLAIYQFSQSSVYGSLSTLFIAVFRFMSSKIVEKSRIKFDDDVYALPFFGATSLTIMLITVKVGAFTSFLTGYLTQIFIKIGTRAFLEPYRIEIKNKVMKIKQRFKLGGGDDPSFGLGFKDRVYIEQINDLAINSMGFISAWIFPCSIVFNYIFYQELKISIPKDFLKYFIVFTFMQAFAEIGYDVFLNNAIECRTGRLLSEKLMDLKGIYEGRRCRWVLSDRTPHSGRTLLKSTENLLRFGFSPQYYFVMTLSTIGMVFQIYAVDFWVLWSYNPFKDVVALFSVPLIVLLLWLLERFALLFGNILKIWNVKENENNYEKEGDFYDAIKYYVQREIEDSSSSSRDELLIKALGRAIYDKYISESNEKRKKAEIIKLLKKLNDAMRIGKRTLDNSSSINDLPLPKIRKPTQFLKLRKKGDVKQILKKPEGSWSPFMMYPWEIMTESVPLNNFKQ
ncbi:unnamed protein product [Blepharisma stoltei]|uniref:Uncharacterized protein n=1 Tax=Blepharisma stoltei TaxID=1481888 RepID=A0AAU9JRG1_9CILI|nr:unnamed protein product [Blepharisma stoltei]